MLNNLKRKFDATISSEKKPIIKKVRIENTVQNSDISLHDRQDNYPQNLASNLKNSPTSEIQKFVSNKPKIKEKELKNLGANPDYTDEMIVEKQSKNSLNLNIAKLLEASSNQKIETIAPFKRDTLPEKQQILSVVEEKLIAEKEIFSLNEKPLDFYDFYNATEEEIVNGLKKAFDENPKLFDNKKLLEDILLFIFTKNYLCFYHALKEIFLAGDYMNKTEADWCEFNLQILGNKFNKIFYEAFDSVMGRVRPFKENSPGTRLYELLFDFLDKNKQKELCKDFPKYCLQDLFIYASIEFVEKIFSNFENGKIIEQFIYYNDFSVLRGIISGFPLCAFNKPIDSGKKLDFLFKKISNESMSKGIALTLEIFNR